MMSWGIQYGQEWGEYTGGPEFLCALAESRIFSWHPTDVGEREFRDFVCVMTEGFGEALEVIDEVENAFDIETAVGVQLDILGSWIGLPRSGQVDTRYRTLLSIQRDIIRPPDTVSGYRVGTGESILQIVRKFIGPTAEPIILTNLYPKDFKLSVPGNPNIAELELLAHFLTKAVWSEVGGHMLVALSEDFWAMDSVHAGPAIPEVGVCGSVHAGAPILDALIMGSIVQIG